MGMQEDGALNAQEAAVSAAVLPETPALGRGGGRKLVSLVVPFFNEGEGIESFHERIAPFTGPETGCDFEIVCVDDGSRDGTLAKLCALADRDPRVRVLELSRNFGKEAAMAAGLDDAAGDAVILLDADLQDPPELIPRFIEAWRNGAEVAVGRRMDRVSDTFFKRQTAEWFYHLFNKVSPTKIPHNVGDARLMDRMAVKALKRLPERQRFLKGLVPWLGFRTVAIDFTRGPRLAGTSKYPSLRLWNYALEGITSFSTVPLKIWTYIGTLGALLSLLYAAFVVFAKLAFGNAAPGYASTIVAILFMGSIQLISVGLLGEYIGRIYMETKQRPLYIVRRQYRNPKGSSE